MINDLKEKMIFKLKKRYCITMLQKKNNGQENLKKSGKDHITFMK